MITLDITKESNWTTEIKPNLNETQQSLARQPSNTETGRKSGMYYFSTYNDYSVPKTVANKTFIFKIQTVYRGTFAVGFINNNNHENVPTANINHLPNGANDVTEGEHTVIWTIDDNMVRNIFYDGELIISTGTLNGNNSDTFSPCIYSWNSEFTLTGIQVLDYCLSEHEIKSIIFGSSDVSGGASTYSLDTTGMSEGKHILKAVYGGDCRHNTAVSRSIFQLDLWHIIDCSDLDNFTNGSRLYNNQYIMAEQSNGVEADITIKRGMTITGTFVSNTDDIVIGLFGGYASDSLSGNSFGRVTMTFIDFTSSPSIVESYVPITTDTSIDFVITISDEGIIRWQDSDGLDRTSNTAYTDYQLSSMDFMMSLMYDNSNEFYLTDLRYKNVYDSNITI